MRLLLPLLLCLLLPSCFWKKKPVPEAGFTLVKRFHGQAQLRILKGDASRKIDLSGLRFEVGSMPGTARYPQGDETSILVAATDPAQRDVAEVIITPHLAAPGEGEESEEDAQGELLPPGPPPVFDQATIAEALQTHRYVYAELGKLTGAPR